MNDVPEPIARALHALDEEAARSAARVDATRVAERVLARLREDPMVVPRPARSGGHGAMLRIAAAVVVLVVGSVVVRKLVFAPPAAGSELAVLAVSLGSDTLSTGQADQLLEAVDLARVAGTDSATTTAATAAVLVDDLTESELQTLLRTMELEEEGR